MKMKLNIKRLILVSLSLLVMICCVKQIEAVTFTVADAENIILKNSVDEQKTSDFFTKRGSVFNDVASDVKDGVYDYRWLSGRRVSVNFIKLQNAVYKDLLKGELPHVGYESYFVFLSDDRVELLHNLEVAAEAYDALARCYIETNVKIS